jgi:tetratricopeptide (TPR) repeat protein
MSDDTPTTAEGWFDAAQRALETGDGNAILDCTERALALDPAHEQAKALRLMVFAQLIPMLEATGKWEKMLAVGEEIERRDMHPMMGRMVQAGAHLELGRFDECARLATQLTDEDPDFAHGFYLVGTSLLRRRRFEDAIPHFERACLVDAQHGEARLNLGMCFDELGRPEEALEVYDEALPLIPDAIFLHGNRGNSLRKLGRDAEALESYERALAVSPGDFHNGRLRAEVLVDLDRGPEALEAILELAGVTADEYRAWKGMPSLDDPRTPGMLCIILRGGPDALREAGRAG